MIDRAIQITNKESVHARPSVFIAQIATLFKKCKISFFKKDSDIEINAKSVMMILAVSISQGEVITIHCDGVNEELALNSLFKLIVSEFNEAVYKQIMIDLKKELNIE